MRFTPSRAWQLLSCSEVGKADQLLDDDSGELNMFDVCIPPQRKL